MGTKGIDIEWVKGRRYTPYSLKYLGGYTLLDILEGVVELLLKHPPRCVPPTLTDSIRRKKSLSLWPKVWPSNLQVDTCRTYTLLLNFFLFRRSFSYFVELFSSFYQNLFFFRFYSFLSLTSHFFQLTYFSRAYFVFVPFMSNLGLFCRAYYFFVDLFPLTSNIFVKPQKFL